MNNPPAFPNHPTSVGVTETAFAQISGMTLRDYFAAAVIHALFSSPHARGAAILLGDDPESVKEVFCRRAFEVADAMLKAREQ